MRAFTFFILLFCLIKTNVHAQLGIQINTGLMNYGGDLQRSPYTFNEARLTAGAALTYNINKFVLSAGLVYGNIQADDKKAKIYKERNLNFKSAISEFNFCVEYDYMPRKENKLIPYVFAGVGAYHYNPYTYYDSQKVYLQPLGTEGEGLSIFPDKKLYALTNIEVPLGIGVKYKVSSDLLIGIEFNSRLIFTDYLDDVSDKYPDKNILFKEHGQLAVDLSYRGDELNPGSTFPTGGTRGNPHQNDNFYTSVITFTYIFPNQHLFGNSSGHGRRAASINCPKKIH